MRRLIAAWRLLNSKIISPDVIHCEDVKSAKRREFAELCSFHFFFSPFLSTGLGIEPGLLLSTVFHRKTSTLTTRPLLFCPTDGHTAFFSIFSKSCNMFGKTGF